jgi:hypothetical protein
VPAHAFGGRAWTGTAFGHGLSFHASTTRPTSPGRGRGAFTHTSWNDFEIVAANLLDNDRRRVSDRITAYALYTDQPLGRIGMTEIEVRKTGKPALLSTLAMERVSRAKERGETTGFMKILVDRDSKQILGASFLGLAGDEVIHCVLDAMYAKAATFSKEAFTPPTLNDLLRLAPRGGAQLTSHIETLSSLPKPILRKPWAWSWCFAAFIAACRARVRVAMPMLAWSLSCCSL